ncbi:long-chain fatty acid--CoA ligase, partial [Streptomyces sp. NPDC004561]
MPAAGRRPGAQATAEEIRAYARERVAAYKCPRVVTVTEGVGGTDSEDHRAHGVTDEHGWATSFGNPG